jgi:hypothetical protein
MTKILQLPGEVERHICEFVGINTRLNVLKLTYTPDFIQSKLKKMVATNKPEDVKKLYSCIQYVKPLLNTYLDKEGRVYQNIRYYIEESDYRGPSDLNYYLMNRTPIVLQHILDIVDAARKHYTKMYSQTSDAEEIRKTEANMIKLFVRIATL